MLKPAAAILALTLLAGCATNAGSMRASELADPRGRVSSMARATIEELPSRGFLSTPIVGRDGSQIGAASFAETPRGVLIRLELEPGALAPGWHGAHLHQVGTCDDFAAGFQAAGGHVGKAPDVQHGLMNPNGPELGDLPNIYAPANSAFGAEMYSSFVTLFTTSIDGRAPLFDPDGSALIIHANPDDQMSQPIGGAGDRVACAALPGPVPISPE